MNFLFPYMARWKTINWTRYHQIFTELAHLGHNVHIIQSPLQVSKETNFQEIDVVIPEKLYLHEITVNPFIWKLNLPLNKLIKKGYYSFKCINETKKLIKEHKIDVLFLYNIPQLPLMNIPDCIKIFDFADDYTAMLKQELGWLCNPLLMIIGQAMLNNMVKKSNLTLAVSKVLADSIKKKNANIVHILPNGVDFEPERIGIGKEIRKKYRTPIIGFIGSFEYFIDFDLILKVACKLSEYTFLLVGSGRDLVRVEKQVEKCNLKNVVLTRGVPHSQIYQYIDAMDICLNIFKKIPISHNACPIKLFEYLIMRKPIISTRLVEIARINEDFLFYGDSTEEIISQIEFIFKNNAITSEYVQRGYEITKQKYTWNKITDQLLEFISKVKS